MERYVIRGGRPGYERLRVLARALLPGTVALDRIGLEPGMGASTWAVAAATPASSWRGGSAVHFARLQGCSLTA